ncbi:hypothetical protein JS533_009445 [Bifidobacterium amazonense]|uniref:Tubuliform spidroin n=1 Tax=Bifidobacterium amazonense TaxID=2809027 RepID=A0ABS9VXE0_9BIFI|nr:hypothetical protein [Bifidobacterium amazonense]MCH9276485.1 hypothetical protein [Bifidobacterium amazonense]
MLSLAVSVTLIGVGSGDPSVRLASTAAGSSTIAASRYLNHGVFASLTTRDGVANVLFGPSGGVYVTDGSADDSASSTDDATGSADPARTSGSGSSDSSTNAVTRTDAGTEALPWRIRVTYSLDGPQKTAAEVDGATGLVGVRVIVERNPLASADIAAQAERLVPMVAFTVPSDVASDISANNGTIVTQNGSDMLVTAVGKAGGHVADDGGIIEDLAEGNIDATSDRTVLDVSVYCTAKRFSMSAVTFAAVPAGDAAAFVSQIDGLAASASSLTDVANGTSGQGNDELISQLTALRDHERELAKTTLAERTAAHRQAFDAYMAAYVGSYTTHLSGSIGTSTQLPALIGTAKELSGDTPLATAVVDLANAVNSVSAAHRHTGAADEVDAIIRRIRQQGTDGLVVELKQQAGIESTQGSKGYSAGQSQLSQAMIPYSMAYTDTYTKHLSELTGGTSAGAAAYQQQAIDATNDDFTSIADLKDDQAKVDAAMSALATASEHTGAAQAIQSLLLRYEDEFENGDSDGGTGTGAGAAGESGATNAESSDDGGQISSGGTGDTVEDAASGSGTSVFPSTQARDGIAASVEAKRQEALAAARRKAAAEQRKAQDSGQITSLVDDTTSMSKDDVMSFAGGISSIGGGAGASSGADASSDSAGSGSSGNIDGTTAAGSSSAATSNETPSVAYGMRGMGSATLLIPGGDDHISETLSIGDAADVLTAAVKALQDNGSLADLGTALSNGTTARFVIMVAN